MDIASGSRRSLGRGFIYITFAKVFFLLTATITSLAFPRLFGDTVLFGRYRVVSGILNVVTMVVITATVQATSRLASQATADLKAVRNAAMLVQAPVFGSIFLAMFFFAGWISDSLLGDPELTDPLRIASLVVAAYAAYAVLVGLLNGRRRFLAQASLDMTFSTLKTTLMIAAVVLTASVTWAFSGFAAAAFIVLGIAVAVCHPVDGNGKNPPVREYAGYLLPLSGYALVMNVLLQADVIAIKGAFSANGHDPRAIADTASSIAGIYGATRNVALLPYQAVISLAFVVFPVVSRASGEGDLVSTKAAAHGAMRLAAVLSASAVAVIGAAPKELLTLLFGESYAEASHILVPLLAAGALVAIMHVANAVLASSGHPGASAIGGVAAVLVQVALLAILLPWDVFLGPALATLLGTGCGATISAYLLCRALKDTRWLFTTAMAALASVAAILTPSSFLPWPIRCLLALTVFFAVLIATRAVTIEDGRRIRSLFR